MDHFTLPCALRINTHGDLDIPANAEVIVGDDGQYVGFIAEDGTPTAHRGFEANLATFVDEPEPGEPEPEPASGPTAQALTEAPTEQPAQEATSGEIDSQ